MLRAPLNLRVRTLTALAEPEPGEKKGIRNERICMVVYLSRISFGLESPSARLKAEPIEGKLIDAIPKGLRDGGTWVRGNG